MSASLWSLSVGTLIALLGTYIISFYRWKRADRYQHPDTLPIFGNLFHITQYRAPFLRWLARQDRRFEGQPYILTFPLVARIVVTHEPADLEYVMKNIDVFIKGKANYEKLFDAFGNGMLGVDGEHWKKQRRIGLLMFTQKNMKSFVDTYLPDQIGRTTKYLASQKNKVIDLEAVLAECTSQLWLQAAFGVKAVNDAKFTPLFDVLTAGIDSRFRNPLWKVTEWAFGSEFVTAARELRPHVRKLVAESDSELVTALKENLQTDDDVVDTALTYLFAGRDTMAVTMAWMFEAMMQQPELFERVREEAAGKGKVDFNDLKDLGNTYPVAHGIFSETLRLYPAVPANMRECHRTTVLPSGVPVEGNSSWIIWSPWVMGRSVRIWGSDAEEFRPERWSENNLDLADNHNPNHKLAYEHPVFHGGPRSCLGQSLAKLVVPYLLIELTKSFDFEKVGDRAVCTNSIMLQIEGGLRCRVLPKNRDSVT